MPQLNCGLRVIRPAHHQAHHRPWGMGVPSGLSHRKETVGAEGPGPKSTGVLAVFLPPGERGCGLVLARAWR